jgi:3-deoxy-D-manno-octulosonic-acid transferase
MKGSPRIWVHAVSVGEVTAAAPIVAALRASQPGACIVLSTSTETGQEMAAKVVPEASSVIYYPLDLPSVVGKVVDLVNPDVFAAVETELWPNFIRACRMRGIPLVLVNGRISGRSFGRYRATRYFWREYLAASSEAGMISGLDAARMREIGMSPERIHVLGNAKYDGLAARVSEDLRDGMRERLNVSAGERFFVAGSTHPGEEHVVLDVFRKLRASHPGLCLILIPRHVERGPEVLEIVRRAGLGDAIAMKDVLAGRPRHRERIVVVDVIGELFKIYSLAEVVFCGGSLVPKGGQNILEAAAWGKVVLYGPHMEDFLPEKALLEEAGAGIPVRDAGEMLERIESLLAEPTELARRGVAGARTVAANQGAARRYAEMILRHARKD